MEKVGKSSYKNKIYSTDKKDSKKYLGTCEKIAIGEFEMLDNITNGTKKK